MSYLQHLSVVSFKKHNPEWEVKLWMPVDRNMGRPSWRTPEQDDGYVGKDFLEETKRLCNVQLVDFDQLKASHLHEVQRSDLIRWWILYEQGGVWSDMDILYIKPIRAQSDFSVCYERPHFFIGFFFAKPKQQIFSDLHEIATDIVRRNSADRYQSLGAELWGNKFGNLSVIKTTYPESKFVALPMEVVYPYRPNSDIYEMFFETIDKTTKHTVGLHWYNGSFVAKEYQNNFDKYRKNPSIISKHVRRLESLL